MLRLSSDWLLGGILSRALADTFKYFRLQRKTNNKQETHQYDWSGINQKSRLFPPVPVSFTGRNLKRKV